MRPFVQVFQETIMALGGDITLTASMWRLIAVLLGACIFGNHIPLSQQQLSLRARLSQSQTSRLLVHLVRKGILLREPPTRGRQWQYRLSTQLAHMGDTAELAWRRSRDHNQAMQTTNS